MARRLLEQVVEDARALGYRAVRLESLDFMRSAHALYRSVGFVESGPYEGLEGARNGVDQFEIFMRLDLDAVEEGLRRGGTGRRQAKMP